jgi:sugar phosphate isomerase/epimerase
MGKAKRNRAIRRLTPSSEIDGVRVGEIRSYDAETGRELAEDYSGHSIVVLPFLVEAPTADEASARLDRAVAEVKAAGERVGARLAVEPEDLDDVIHSLAEALERYVDIKRRRDARRARLN